MEYLTLYWKTRNSIPSNTKYHHCNIPWGCSVCCCCGCTCWTCCCCCWVCAMRRLSICVATESWSMGMGVVVVVGADCCMGTLGDGVGRIPVLAAVCAREDCPSSRLLTLAMFWRKQFFKNCHGLSYKEILSTNKHNWSTWCSRMTSFTVYFDSNFPITVHASTKYLYLVCPVVLVLTLKLERSWLVDVSRGVSV